MASTTPNPAASAGSMRPMGMGRLAVRLMIASMSRSYHMLMAPEAPAPTAMQRMATAAISGWIWPGATIIPAKPEKTTSDITRGFSSCRKSETRAPSCAAENAPCPAAGKSSVASLNEPASPYACLTPPLFNDGQLLVAVEGRRRTHRPFQRRRTFAPVIGAHFLAGKQRVEHHADEPDRAGIGDVGADGGDVVPAGKGVRIVGDAPRHAGQPQDMHGEEGHVHADEGDPEMDLARPFRILAAAHLADPV